MPILIGSNSFEASVMKVVGVDEASLLAQAPASVRAAYGDGSIDDARLAESIFTDASFGAPARWIALKMSATAPAYVYYFSYVTSQRRSLAKGAGHGSEIIYVFETGGWLEKLYGVKLSEQDRRMAHLMHSCWVGFVRYGNPHCDGAKWPRLDSNHDEILEFGAQTRVRTHFKSKIYDALQKVYLRRALNHRVRR
jgi:para-nitrobenzyl esterase